MPTEQTFQYTHVEAGLVENVVVRRTDDTETYPSGWKYPLHLGTLEDLTLVRYDNAHEDTKGHNIIPQPTMSMTLHSPEWKNASSNSGRVQTSTGMPSTAARIGPTDHNDQPDTHDDTPHHRRRPRTAP